MSETYELHNRRHRRLSILRVLAGSGEYRANDSLLTTLVNEFGIVSTRDQVRSDLAWLKEQGFVTVRDAAGVMVATLSEAGGEIAAGRRTDPGVAKPSPKG
jgi:hypothetical protein